MSVLVWIFCGLLVGGLAGLMVILGAAVLEDRRTDERIRQGLRYDREHGGPPQPRLMP